jgi:DNA-damage-inducible protein J
MANTVLNVRVDETLKKTFDEFCANVGMNSSVAVNMFMRAVVRERRIPFEIRDANATPVFNSDELNAKQKLAVESFINNVNAVRDEPLDEEFDAIMADRVNITRELDL